MNIPPKYEDVVAKLYAAEVITQAGEHVECHLEKQIDILRIDLESSKGREAALREELKSLSAIRNQNRVLAETVKEVEFISASLQQRLTVAKQLLSEALCHAQRMEPISVSLFNRIDSAIDTSSKPSAEGEGS